MARDIQQKVLIAAVETFARYGFQKTTMNDIANAANVARQTLYNLYPNKAAVISAAALHFSEEAINGINKAITPDMSLSEKLNVFFNHYIIKGYLLTQHSPDASDLVNVKQHIAEDVKTKTNQLFTDLFKEILEPHKKRISELDLDIDEVADTIYGTLSTTKYHATDLDHLKRIQKNLILMIAKHLDHK